MPISVLSEREFKRNKMKKVNLLLVCIVLCFSCSKQGKEGVMDFDKVEYISSYDSIYADIDEPMGPVVELHVSGNMLVLNHANDDKQFSFIDIESGRLVCRWGTVGEGSNEFIDFSSNFSLKDSCLIFQTSATKEINHVSLPDILNHRSILRIAKEAYPYSADFRPRRIYPFHDKKIALGSFKEGVFGLLEKDNTLISCEGDFPFSCDKVDGIYRGNLYQSRLLLNEDKNRFALFYMVSDAFEIYELDGRGMRKVYMSPFRSVPQLRERGERFSIDYDNSVAGFMTVSASSKLIGCTYSAKSYQEAASQDMVSDEILCFDWEGKKVQKYVLPFAISNFCMDAEYLYAVRYVDNQTVIYRFKL